MIANSRKIDVLHIDDGENRLRQEETVCEFLLRLLINDRQEAVLRCSPENMEALVTGFLASKRIIGTKEEIQELAIDEGTGIAKVRTRGVDRNDKKTAEAEIVSGIRLTRIQILSLYRRFQESSVLHRKTNAAHSAALCTPEKIDVYAEDIGRHNAVDRVIGGGIIQGIPPAERILLTSCRVSSDLVEKAATVNIPVLISKSAPTDRGVEAARRCGMTLVGFVFRTGMNIYTGAERIDNGPGLPPGDP